MDSTSAFHKRRKLSKTDSISTCHKRQKVGKAVKTVESIDRISNLPRPLLCHILSFLPTKYAVGTSILSTRWKNLFTAIPNIDLDDSLLLLHSQAVNQNLARKMPFVDFVYRVINRRHGWPIDRFRLKCGKKISASTVNSWVSSALFHNVRELDLCISMREFAILPFNLFTSTTLVVSKVGVKFVLNIRVKVCLPKLKTIHLNDIEFFDDDSIRGLLSGCPMIEELIILGCDWNNIHVFRISSRTLKSLTINCLPEGGEYSTEFCKYKIVINAPNLEYLAYIDFVPDGFSAKHLRSLVKAHIDVGFRSRQLEDDNPNHKNSIAEILRVISKAQFLHLSKDFMQAIGLNYQMLPTFSKVTHLELLVDHFVGWQMLPDLLQSSPFLQTLAFKEGLFDCDHGCNYIFEWVPPLAIPSCLLFHLKTIKIELFEGQEEELNVVKYFLKNARVLEKMTIHKQVMGEKEARAISNKLLMLPRGSNACQVVIS